MRAIIFGDTGGQEPNLRLAIEEITEGTYLLPEDVRVIHLGDLVHRGPRSAATVSLVEQMQELNPGRWIQLIGNHEAMHLEWLGVHRFYRCNCGDDAVKALRAMDERGELRIAAGLEGVTPRRWTAGNRPRGQEELARELLCLHGGLTKGFWGLLEQPSSVRETIARLERSSAETLRSEGVMTLGFPQFNAGPIWATAGEEVAASWGDDPMPFSQAVGHSTPYIDGHWRPGLPQAVRKRGKAVPDERRAVLFGEQGVILAQDPGYGASELPKVQPYLAVECANVIG